MSRSKVFDIFTTGKASEEALPELTYSCEASPPPLFSPRQTGIMDSSSKEAFYWERVYFPLGFPVRVRSNRQAVLAAAEQSWGRFQSLFPADPLELCLTIKPGVTRLGALPPAPTFRLSGSLLVLAADTENFIIVDLEDGRAVGTISEAVANAPGYLRYHFLEAVALSMLAVLRTIAVHGACVAIGDAGILLCGDSGAGKSTLAFACARAGWTYITDDASYFPMERGDRLAVGNHLQVRFRPSAAELFPEVVGRSLTPRVAGKPSIEVPTSEWPWIKTASAAQVDYIVFLNRTSAEERELSPIDSLEVAPWFRQSILSTPTSAPLQEAALQRLLTAPAFELRYRDLPWAIDRIHQLALRGR